MEKDDEHGQRERTEVWLDSVDLGDVTALATDVDGLTTNPIILRKNPTTAGLDVRALEQHFAELFRHLAGKPVMMQVVSLDAERIVAEARALVQFGREHGARIGVKIPAVTGGIWALRQLHAEGMLTLGTTVFRPEQTYHCGLAGADYCSTYTARMTAHARQTDSSVDGVELAHQVLAVLRHQWYSTKLLAANFRSGPDEIGEVNAVIEAGAHGVTVTRAVYAALNRLARGTAKPRPFTLELSGDLRRVLQHPQTRQALEEFTAAAEVNPAYLQLIYRRVLGRDPTAAAIADVTARARQTLAAEYQP